MKKKQISVHDVIIENISSKQQVETLTLPQKVRHLLSCLSLLVGSARESNSNSFSDKWKRQWHLALQTKKKQEKLIPQKACYDTTFIRVNSLNLPFLSVSRNTNR